MSIEFRFDSPETALFVCREVRKEYGNLRMNDPRIVEKILAYSSKFSNISIWAEEEKGRRILYIVRIGNEKVMQA